MLENKKLRRIFGPSGEKVKGGWKNHTLCNFLIYAVMKFCYDDEGERGESEGHALRQREMRESQGRGPHWRKVNVVVMTVDLGKIYGGLL
jgi:hypothetical protein